MGQTMTPFLVSGPETAPVELAAAQDYCRVMAGDDDAVLAMLLATAVAHLDGWDGQLGRCIMAQTWAADLPAGWHVLPMPDVTAAVATYGDATTEDLAVTPTAAGPAVSLPAAARVAFTCALPDRLLPRVRAIVLQLVALWYDHRGAADTDLIRMVPGSTRALIDGLRWGRA